MIHLAEPNLTGNERKYLNECIDTTFVSSVGAFVSKFEEEVVRVTEADFGTAVSSGTAGLHMALKAVGVEKDELVKEVLGTHTSRRYIKAKKKEWAEYSRQVSGWELDQYLYRI